MVHEIRPGDAKSIEKQLKRLNLRQQEEIARQNQELLEMKTISPCEGEWAANVLLAKKKDTTKRKVMD